MTTPMKNFAISTVSIPPSPATTGTTLSVSDVSLFPDPTDGDFDLTVWPSGVEPLASNAEIVTVTHLTGSQFTVTRHQQSTSAIAIQAGYQIEQGVTAGLLQSGGSNAVTPVNLGVLDLATIFASGPSTVSPIGTSEFLASVRFADTDFVAPDTETAVDSTTAWVLTFAIGTIKSLGWWGFANTGGYPVSGFTDTYGLFTGSADGTAYGPDLGQTGKQAMVLSAGAGGPVQASWIVAPAQTPADGSSVRCDAISDWAASTAYDAPADNTPDTSGALQNCCVIGNGSVWINIGTGGTSGSDAPDFAGNEGGTVNDGDDIVWSDTTQPAPTVGAVRAVAEIWTPVAP